MIRPPKTWSIERGPIGRVELEPFSTTAIAAPAIAVVAAPVILCVVLCLFFCFAKLADITMRPALSRIMQRFQEAERGALTLIVIAITGIFKLLEEYLKRIA